MIIRATGQEESISPIESNTWREAVARIQCMKDENSVQIGSPKLFSAYPTREVQNPKDNSSTLASAVNTYIRVSAHRDAHCSRSRATINGSLDRCQSIQRPKSRKLNEFIVKFALTTTILCFRNPPMPMILRKWMNARYAGGTRTIQAAFGRKFTGASTRIVCRAALVSCYVAGRLIVNSVEEGISHCVL